MKTVVEFSVSVLQLDTNSLCVLALQNSPFEASTSSLLQTVNFVALGHKAIVVSCFKIFSLWPELRLSHKLKI